MEVVVVFYEALDEVGVSVGIDFACVEVVVGLVAVAAIVELYFYELGVIVGLVAVEVGVAVVFRGFIFFAVFMDFGLIEGI
jgi:hypothetical protein